MKYKELDFVSLFFYIFIHWRSLIIAGFICALLALGGDVAKALIEYKQVNSAEEITPPISEKDKDVVYVYSGSVMNYNNMKEMLKNSAYMALDGKNVAKTEVVMVVKGQGAYRVMDIADIYRKLATSQECSEYICETEGIQSTCVDELIRVYWNSDNNDDINNDINNNKNDIITVNLFSDTETEAEEAIFLGVLGVDEDASSQTAELLIDYLNKKKADIAPELGEHELIVVSKTTSVGTDSEVIMNQRENYKTLIGLYDTVTNREKNLTEEQRNAYESFASDGYVWESENITENEITSDKVASAKTWTLNINKKFILVGFAFGAFYMAFMWALVYVLGNRIKVDDKYEKLWDVTIMGIIPAEHKKKKLLGFVDGWIISLRDRDRRRFSAEETISQIVSKVKIQSTKDKVSNLVFIGCDLEKNVPEIPSVMAGKVGEADINAIVLDNVLYNPENTEKLGGMDGAVIIEKVGKTRYSELTEEIEILKRQQIKLLGMVVVE